MDRGRRKRRRKKTDIETIEVNERMREEKEISIYPLLLFFSDRSLLRVGRNVPIVVDTQL